MGTAEAEHGSTQDSNISKGRRRDQTSGGAFFQRAEDQAAKAIRRNGVTGAVEGSRYHGADFPRHSYLGRVCTQQQREKGEGYSLGGATAERRPGEAIYPDPKLSTTQVMHLDGRLSKPLRVMLK